LVKGLKIKSSSKDPTQHQTQRYAIKKKKKLFIHHQLVMNSSKT